MTNHDLDPMVLDASALPPEPGLVSKPTQPFLVKVQRPLSEPQASLPPTMQTCLITDRADRWNTQCTIPADIYDRFFYVEADGRHCMKPKIYIWARLVPDPDNTQRVTMEFLPRLPVPACYW